MHACSLQENEGCLINSLFSSGLFILSPVRIQHIFYDQEVKINSMQKMTWKKLICCYQSRFIQDMKSLSRWCAFSTATELHNRPNLVEKETRGSTKFLTLDQTDRVNFMLSVPLWWGWILLAGLLVTCIFLDHQDHMLSSDAAATRLERRALIFMERKS